jgi:hypothetical protein
MTSRLSQLNKKDLILLNKYREGKTSTKSNIIIPTDWVDFCSLLKVRSGNKYVNLVPYDYQIDLYNTIESHNFTLVVKSRQMGFSMTVILIFLFKAINNPAYTAIVFSKGQKDTSNLARRMRALVDELQRYGIGETKNSNAQNIAFKYGGDIHFLNSKPEAGRGIDSVSDIFYDEAGFIEKIEMTFEANMPSQEMVGDQARTIIGSTPNGQAGWYYQKLMSDNPDEKNPLDIIEKVRSGALPPTQIWTDNSGWAKYVTHWKAHPVYSKQGDYLENITKKKKASFESVKQEYDLCFNSAASMVFLSQLVKSTCHLKQLEDTPKESSDYYITLDTATIGKDYVVAMVFESYDDHYSQVEMYRKREKPSEYHIYQVSELIDKYKPIKVGIEITGGVGQVYLERLQIQHPDITFVKIRTTGESKPMMIERLNMLLEQHKLSLADSSMIRDEFLSFQKKEDGKMEAVSGSHDDIVMATAFLTMLIEDFTYYKYADLSLPTAQKNLILY